MSFVVYAIIAIKYFMILILLPQIVVVVQWLNHVHLFASYELQYTRLTCPSLFHRICSNSYPLSQWCHPTISPSMTPFSSCPQFSPTSEFFLMNQLFTSGGQRIVASASVHPMNIQDWFPLGLTGLISLLSKALSRIFSSTTVQKHQFFNPQPSLWSNSHIHTWLWENHSFD